MAPGAIILCGGRSRRMGRPKAWIKFDGEHLLYRVVRQVGAEARPVVVVAAPDQELPPIPSGVLLVRDPIPNLGPLQGLVAGLAALPPHVEFGYVTATDAPFLARGWIERLVSLIGAADAAMPHVDGRSQPLSAIYRRGAVLPVAADLLASRDLRLRRLSERLTVRMVEADELRDLDPDLRTIRNLNTRDDLGRARAEARSSGSMRHDTP